MTLRFANPMVLWLLALLPVLGGLVALAEAARRRKLERFVGGLAARLSRGDGRGGTRAALRLAALGFLILALADPRFGHKVEEVTRRGVDVLFVVDVSASMRAEDVRPSRLAKAKAEIRHMVRALEGDRVGVVVFAGLPDALVPLTADRGAFEMFLDLVDPSLIPVPGTDLGAALALGRKVLGEDDLKYKVMVLVTDGEDHEGRGLAVAKEAARAGVRIHSVLVGKSGAPVPTAEGFKKDESGSAVLTRPDPQGLSAIAAATGGGFYQATGPRLELGELLSELQSMEDRDLHSEEVRNMEERFQIPLALCVLLLFLEQALEPTRRKGGRRLA